MQENAEYCTGQNFSQVYMTSHNRIWQCGQCAYHFLQPVTDVNAVAIPAYHPKPIPLRFAVSEEQRVGLYKQIVHDEIRQQITRREKRLSELRSTYPRDIETIGKIEHGVMTLLELEHNLHLCDCPDEAYGGSELIR